MASKTSNFRGQDFFNFVNIPDVDVGNWSRDREVGEVEAGVTVEWPPVNAEDLLVLENYSVAEVGVVKTDPVAAVWHVNKFPDRDQKLWTLKSLSRSQCHKLILEGREPWTSGYGWWLMFKRSWVQITAPLHLILEQCSSYAVLK